MKLSFEQIKETVNGAVRVYEMNGEVCLYRLTTAQQEVYRDENGYNARVFSSAGMRLDFLTDSENFFLKVNTLKSASRSFFSYDVFVNGEYWDSLDNFSGKPMPQNYTEYEFPLGEYSKNFSLGKDIKQVTVYMPWSVATRIREIEIDDNCFIKGLKCEKKMLVFGDSISQGYDALRSYNRYAGRIAQSLGAQEFNKAIGGDIFNPKLAQNKDSFEPDYISVAYGTNDWSLCTKEEFTANAFAFFAELRKNYPKAKIFAITPIWRADWTELRPLGNFFELSGEIKKATEGLDIEVIDGFSLIPADTSLFSDGYLHPNDKGFDLYFNSLYGEIMKKL